MVRYGECDRQTERRQRIAVGKICAMVFRPAAQPDLTLDEVMVAKKAARIPGSRSAVGRIFCRHDLTVKKKPVRRRAAASGRDACTPALDTRARLARSCTAGLYRRDCHQHQRGSVERPLPARSAAGRIMRPTDIGRRSRSSLECAITHSGAFCDGRSDERAYLCRAGKAVSRSNAKASRCRHYG